MGLTLGIFIFLPFGLFLGLAISSFTMAAVEARHKRHIVELQMSVEALQRLVERTAPITPLEIGAIGKFTDLSVIGGYCCICDSDHEGLVQEPYRKRYHQALCPVPLARVLYLKRCSLTEPRPNPQPPAAVSSGGIRRLPPSQQQ